MMQIIFVILSFLVGLATMGKGKQITINRKNRVISELKQDRSNLRTEVEQYKNVKKITDSVSSTSIAIDSLQDKVLQQVDSVPEKELADSPKEAEEIEEGLEDDEDQTEEETDEKIYVLAGDQSVRTKRLADLLQ